MVHTSLIGKMIDFKGEQYEITYKLVQMTEHKLAGQKRTSLKKAGNKDYQLCYDDIIKKYDITAETVLRNIPSLLNVEDKHQRQAGEKKDIKIDDIRYMAIGLTNLDGYTQSEKDYITSRLPEYERDYDIEKAADKFKALRAIVCEMKILQLELLLTNKPKGDADIQKQIDALDKQHAFHCDGLNVLKKQRDNAKQKPDTEGSISKVVNEMNKPISELQKEADELKQKKEKFLKERNKRK